VRATILFSQVRKLHRAENSKKESVPDIATTAHAFVPIIDAVFSQRHEQHSNACQQKSKIEQDIHYHETLRIQSHFPEKESKFGTPIIQNTH